MYVSEQEIWIPWSKKMEPFNFALNQVNFEEKDISGDDQLHSFGDLCHYDSDFKDSDTEARPVAARRVIPGTCESSSSIRINVYFEMDMVLGRYIPIILWSVLLLLLPVVKKAYLFWRPENVLVADVGNMCSRI